MKNKQSEERRESHSHIGVIKIKYIFECPYLSQSQKHETLKLNGTYTEELSWQPGGEIPRNEYKKQRMRVSYPLHTFRVHTTLEYTVRSQVTRIESILRTVKEKILGRTPSTSLVPRSLEFNSSRPSQGTDNSDWNPRKRALPNSNLCLHYSYS